MTEAASPSAPSPGPSAPFWISVFLDLAPEAHEEDSRFWAEATGCTPSPARGGDGEFHTLLPRRGDAHLKVQRLGRGPSRLHLDLHVVDPAAAAASAVAAGARLLADHPADGYVVLASPGGLTFCLVSHPASDPCAPVTWPDGHLSSPDQLCLDVPPALHAREAAFWRSVTARELRPVPGHPEFHRLVRPHGQPLRLLLQRLDGPAPEVGAHLDFATTDRAAETERHLAAGARLVRTHPRWTVLRSPSSLAYCLTDRTP